jgi:hypothetical protein
VHVPFEPGRAGEQSLFPWVFCSERHPFCSWRCLIFSPCPWELYDLLGSVAKGPKFHPQNIKMSFQKLLLVYLIFFYHFGWSSRKLFIWQHWPVHFAPRHVPSHGINMLNFRYEDGVKINNNYFPALSRELSLSTETISKPPQSHETIPLKQNFIAFSTLIGLHILNNKTSKLLLFI